MRGRLAIVTFLAGVYACGSSKDTNFGDPAGGGARGGDTASGGMNGGAMTGAGTAGDSAGTSGSGAGGSSGGTTAGGATGSDAGAGATLSAGAGGDQGMAGAAGAGGSPEPEGCPGTLKGCVIDWAGTHGTLEDPSVDGIGQDAVFGDADGDPNSVLRGITGDGTYLYVTGNNCVRRIEIATAEVVTIAGQCGTAAYVNDVGTDARFGQLDGLATDGITLWVADSGYSVIRTIDLASFDVNYLTGDPGMAGNNNGGPSTAEFYLPRGMVYQDGYLYVVEQGNHSIRSIRRVDPSNGNVTLLAGDNGIGETDGNGDQARFNQPRKITGDGMDLYVSDTLNHLLRLVVPAADRFTTDVSTLAGNRSGAPNTPGWEDATGQLARFYEPRGITFDGTDLLVADTLNCVIRHVTLPDGIVTTIAGAVEEPCATHAVGVGTEARFNRPFDLHYDAGTGDLFILENSVIRRMYYK
jgi:hypothetical protein